MKRDVKLRLFDIALVLDEIEASVAGLVLEQYLVTDNLPESTNWRLVVAGEAANGALRVQRDLAETFPDLAKLVAVRNRIVHGYFSVDKLQVWTIVTEDLPGLAERLRQYMDGST